MKKKRFQKIIISLIILILGYIYYEYRPQIKSYVKGSLESQVKKEIPPESKKTYTTKEIPEYNGTPIHYFER